MSKVAHYIKTSSNPHSTLYSVLKSVPDPDNKVMLKTAEQRSLVRKIYRVAEKLRLGMYHEYLTYLAAPKKEMYDDLMEIGWPNVAQLVKEGVFNEEEDTDWKNEKSRAMFGKDKLEVN